jgi:hypothetical protein
MRLLLPDDAYQILYHDTEIKAVTNITFISLGAAKLQNVTLILGK